MHNGCRGLLFLQEVWVRHNFVTCVYSMLDAGLSSAIFEPKPAWANGIYVFGKSLFLRKITNPAGSLRNRFAHHKRETGRRHAQAAETETVTQSV